MKKWVKWAFIALFAMFFVLHLCFCGVKRTPNQTQKHFEKFKLEIQRIVAAYDSEATIIEEQKDRYSQSLFINTGKAIIEVRIFNDIGYDRGTNKRSVEKYYICYVIDDPTADQVIDVELFADLVNCVSMKRVSTATVEEFLAAPPEKYPASRFGGEEYSGEEGEPIRKIRALDLLELHYGLKYQQTGSVEELSLFGFTRFW